jgi:hypothetical protein
MQRRVCRCAVYSRLEQLDHLIVHRLFGVMQELIEESEVVHHRHRMLLVRILKLEQPLILNARHFLDRQLPQEEDTVKDDLLHRSPREDTSTKSLQPIIVRERLTAQQLRSIRCLLMQ